MVKINLNQTKFENRLNNLYQTRTSMQPINDKGWKSISKTGNTADLTISKNKIPTIYNDIMRRFAEIETAPSGWTAGKSSTGGEWSSNYSLFYNETTSKWYLFNKTPVGNKVRIFNGVTMSSDSPEELSYPSGFSAASSDSGNYSNHVVQDCGDFYFILGSYYYENYGGDDVYVTYTGFCLFDPVAKTFNYINYDLGGSYTIPYITDDYIYLFSKATGYNASYTAKFYRIPKRYDITVDDIELLKEIPQDGTYIGDREGVNDMYVDETSGYVYFLSSATAMKLIVAPINTMNDLSTWRYYLLRTPDDISFLPNYSEWEPYPMDYKDILYYFSFYNNYMWITYYKSGYLISIKISDVVISELGNYLYTNFTDKSEVQIISDNFYRGYYTSYIGEAGWHGNEPSYRDNKMYIPLWRDYQTSWQGYMELDYVTKSMSFNQIFSDTSSNSTNICVNDDGIFTRVDRSSGTIYYSAISPVEYMLEDVPYYLVANDNELFKFVLISNASLVDKYYKEYGYSPFWIIDQTNEKLGFPRNNNSYTYMYVDDDYVETNGDERDSNFSKAVTEKELSYTKSLIPQYIKNYTGAEIVDNKLTITEEMFANNTRMYFATESTIGDLFTANNWEVKLRFKYLGRPSFSGDCTFACCSKAPLDSSAYDHDGFNFGYQTGSMCLFLSSNPDWYEWNICQAFPINNPINMTVGNVYDFKLIYDGKKYEYYGKLASDTDWTLMHQVNNATKLASRWGENTRVILSQSEYISSWSYQTFAEWHLEGCYVKIDNRVINFCNVTNLEALNIPKEKPDEVKLITDIDLMMNNWDENDDEEYKYKADINVDGVTENDYAVVNFSAEQAASGNYSSINETLGNKVTVYSKVNDFITIPNIVIYKSNIIEYRGAARSARLMDIASYVMDFTPSGEYDKDSLKFLSIKQIAGNSLSDLDINKNLFLAKVESDLGIITAKKTENLFKFTYNGESWDLTGAANVSGITNSDLSSVYGITYTGTAVSSDVIRVIESHYNKFEVYVLDSNYRTVLEWNTGNVTPSYSSDPESVQESATYFNNIIWNTVSPLSNSPLFNYVRGLGLFTLPSGVKLYAVVPNAKELRVIANNKVALDALDTHPTSGKMLSDYIAYNQSAATCQQPNDSNDWYLRHGEYWEYNYKYYAVAATPVLEVPSMKD